MRFTPLLVASLCLGVQAKPCSSVYPSSSSTSTVSSKATSSTATSSTVTSSAATSSTATSSTATSSTTSSASASCTAFVLQVVGGTADGQYIKQSSKSRNGVTNDNLAYGAASQSAAAVLALDASGHLYYTVSSEYLNIGSGGAKDGSSSIAYLNTLSAITSSQYQPVCAFVASSSSTTLSCNSSSAAGYSTTWLYPSSGSATNLYVGVPDSDYSSDTLNVICV